MMIDGGAKILMGALFPLLVVAASPAADAAGPLEFGAALGTSWYDHRSTADGPTTFSLRTLKPYVRYDGALGNWDVRGLAQRRMEFYSGDAIDSVLNTSQHAHDRIQLRALRQWSERGELSLEGGYVRSHDLLEADQGTVVVDGNVTRWTGAVGTRVDLFEGAARLRTTAYDGDPSLVGSRAFGWTARLVPVRRSFDAVFLGLSDSQLEVADTTVLISRLAGVGYRRRVMPLLTAEIEVGAAETRFADGSRQQRPMVGLGLERDPARGAALGFVLHARFEGDSAAALAGEARYRMAAGRVWLRAESLADAEGGLVRQATRTRRFSLGIEDTLGRANVLGFEGSYIRTRALRGDGSGTEILRTSGWVMRRIQPWLNARLAASYLREPLGARRFEPVFRRIRLDAELIVLSSGFGTTMFRALSGLVGPGRAG
jgi:hypothetical protein